MSDATHKKIDGSHSKLFKNLNKKMSDHTDDLHEKPTGELKIRLVLEREFHPEVLEDVKSFLELKKRHRRTDEHSEFNWARHIVEHFCEEHDMRVVNESERTRIITIMAPVPILEKFFKVELGLYEYEKDIKNSTHSRVVMGHAEHVSIPHALHGIVHSVIGLRHTPLDPQAVTMKQISEQDAISAAFGKTSQWMAEYYSFPENTTGKGQHIGIIACGGGFEGDEYLEFFKRVGLSNIPKMNVVEIDGVGNNPGENWLYE